MRKVMRALAAATILASISGCATASVKSVSNTTSALTHKEEIRLRMARVADWQLAHMAKGSFPVRRLTPQTFNERGWVMGTFFVGLADAADALRKPEYDQALVSIAERNGWRLGDRLTHADDHLVGLIYQRYATHKNKPDYIAPTKATFDQILARNSQVSLEFIEGGGSESGCQQRWCWADALFMAPASFIAIGVSTKEDRYIAFADREFWATTDYLYDKEAKLFYRDSRFFSQRGPDGEKVYWARGNGWVYAGIANILRTLPKNDPRRARYITLFKEMSDKLVSLQQDNGYWHTSLASKRPEPPETSGTGFFTYGLAWGVNEGILKGEKYTRAARLGWSGLNRHVEAEGRLGYVQQIGDRPGAVQPDDMQFYGPGAYLLAGAQMLKMEGGN